MDSSLHSTRARQNSVGLPSQDASLPVRKNSKPFTRSNTTDDSIGFLTEGPLVPADKNPNQEFGFPMLQKQTQAVWEQALTLPNALLKKDSINYIKLRAELYFRTKSYGPRGLEFYQRAIHDLDQETDPQQARLDRETLLNHYRSFRTTLAVIRNRVLPAQIAEPYQTGKAVDAALLDLWGEILSAAEKLMRRQITPRVARQLYNDLNKKFDYLKDLLDQTLASISPLDQRELNHHMERVNYRLRNLTPKSIRGGFAPDTSGVEIQTAWLELYTNQFRDSIKPMKEGHGKNPDMAYLVEARHYYGKVLDMAFQSLSQAIHISYRF